MRNAILLRHLWRFVLCGVALLTQPGFAQTGTRAASPAGLDGAGYLRRRRFPMEGVLVTAKKTNSTIAITVVSERARPLPISRRENSMAGPLRNQYSRRGI